MTAPDRLDPELAKHRLRDLDSAQRRVAHLVAVDDLAGASAGSAAPTTATSSTPASTRSRIASSSLRPPATSFRNARTVPPAPFDGRTGGVGGRGHGSTPRPCRPRAGSAAPTSASAGPRIACRAPGHAVLVRAADDARDLVEVEDRRRRGDQPLDRLRAPRVVAGERAPPPADDHVVEEDQLGGAEQERRSSEISRFQSPNWAE